MPTGEEDLKNWIPFFLRVTACSLKDNVSEETVASVFTVEKRVQNIKTNYVLTQKN
jgi:hypothetical protein